jgi:hypothetical protein
MEKRNAWCRPTRPRATPRARIADCATIDASRRSATRMQLTITAPPLIMRVRWTSHRRTGGRRNRLGSRSFRMSGHHDFDATHPVAAVCDLHFLPDRSNLPTREITVPWRPASPSRSHRSRCPVARGNFRPPKQGPHGHCGRPDIHLLLRAWAKATPAQLRGWSPNPLQFTSCRGDIARSAGRRTEAKRPRC